MKFKSQTQYYFGKLQEGANKVFARTPKCQILTGNDLLKRGINTFDEYYSLNPSNFKEGDNISICVKNEHGSFDELMTKTILTPVKKEHTETLADNDIPSLDLKNRTIDNTNNKNLIESYTTQIEFFKSENTRLQELVNRLQNETIDMSRHLAELEVEKERAEEKLNQKTAEYDKLWKEFGDLIKEARNNSNTPTLSDRLGGILADPEIIGFAKVGIAELINYVKDKRNPAQLKDTPPAHITENENEVFNE